MKDHQPGFTQPIPFPLLGYGSACLATATGSSDSEPVSQAPTILPLGELLRLKFAELGVQHGETMSIEEFHMRYPVDDQHAPHEGTIPSEESNT